MGICLSSLFMVKAGRKPLTVTSVLPLDLDWFVFTDRQQTRAFRVDLVSHVGDAPHQVAAKGRRETQHDRAARRTARIVVSSAPAETRMTMSAIAISAGEVIGGDDATCWTSMNSAQTRRSTPAEC